MLTWIKRIVVVVVLLGLVGAAGAWYWGGAKTAAMQFRTAKIERGDLVASIGATGTLEPDEAIDVGSQVTGQIKEFGVDTNGKPLDYIGNVKAGMLLAKIDDTTYIATLDEANAQLQQAQAGVQRAAADKLTAQAKLTQAQSDWERAEKIGPGDVLAQTTYDTYKSTFEQGKAAVAVADAAMATANATVAQAESTVNRAQRNVDFCTIKSPVDGFVIDRRVNIGQTVVSTQSASSLFLIGRDLSKMQVWVAVNEADTHHIYAGQPVTFTCDAFGERTFRGTVKKMRLNAQMTQNVVTYTVEVSVDNADKALLPYLTANVQFETERQNDTLMVPNGALRWMPTAEQIAPSAREASATTTPDATKPAADRPKGEGHGKKADKPANKSAGKSGTVWVKDGEFVRPVAVVATVTDGANTAVTGDGLSEGTEVVTGTVAVDTATAQGPTNPFMPQMGRRGGGGGGGGRGGR